MITRDQAYREVVETLVHASPNEPALGALSADAIVAVGRALAGRVVELAAPETPRREQPPAPAVVRRRGGSLAARAMTAINADRLAVGKERL